MSQPASTQADHTKSDERTKESSENQTPTQVLEGEALKDALKKQLDYYFSKENLVSDKYLLSQMNTDMFVPINVIAGFKMIKALTANFDDVVNALKELKTVNLDETESMVRPNIRAHRNTIIIRDIPSTTPVEEVKAIFVSDKCGKVLDIHGDVGDNWYVTLEEDETAMKTLEFLRTTTFKGQPVKARIKTENTFRSLYASAFYAASGTTEQPSEPQTNYGHNYKGGYSGQQNWVGVEVPASYASYNGYGYENDPNYSRGYDNRRGGSYRRQASGGRNYSRGGRGGYKGHSGSRENTQSSSTAGTRKRRESGGSTTLQLTPQHFPPLPSANQKKSGYAGEFQKYSKQDIVDIISGLKISKPEDLPAVKTVVENPAVEIEVTKPWPKRLEESMPSDEQKQNRGNQPPNTTTPTAQNSSQEIAKSS